MGSSDGGAPGADSGGSRQDASPERPRSEVHLIGRFEHGGEGPRFAFPGSAIAARFTGSRIAIRLDDSGSNLFDVRIDGERRAVLELEAGPQTYELASDLGAGEHQLVVARRTESFFGPTRFLGLEGATLVPSPAPPRWIELVGDSITCGYGVLGEGPGCPFTAETESELDAWGALAAEELGAAHVAVAYSGRGMLRNNDGDNTQVMPAVYERTFADDAASRHDFEQYRPDVIVVALGTNDFAMGDPGAGFVTAYLAFVRSLRERHPSAYIIVAESSMLGGDSRTRLREYLDDVVAQADDERVVLLEIAEQSADDGIGCHWHPSRATQEIMASALVARIRSLTGW